VTCFKTPVHFKTTSVARGDPIPTFEGRDS
jgi:hypothetical protein